MGNINSLADIIRVHGNDRADQVSLVGYVDVGAGGSDLTYLSTDLAPYLLTIAGGAAGDNRRTDHRRTAGATPLPGAQQGYDIVQGITMIGDHILDRLRQLILGLLLAMLQGHEGVVTILLVICDKPFNLLHAHILEIHENLHKG